MRAGQTERDASAASRIAAHLVTGDVAPCADEIVVNLLAVFLSGAPTARALREKSGTVASMSTVSRERDYAIDVSM
jgi:hypothetical protein